MVKDKFITEDYQMSLLRKMKNLKKKQLTIKEYTKQFYKVNIRVGYVEVNPERDTKYIIGL